MQTVGLIHTLEQCLNRMQTVGLIHTLEQCLNRMQTVGLIHTLEQCLNRMQTKGAEQRNWDTLDLGSSIATFLLSEQDSLQQGEAWESPVFGKLHS
ncbi:hypothetical protein AAFF_G00021630 [Aldrovandia affinis]|uniref:Uncharacterized protein n=1 Tax=Aldrovandia affinis TaxID=143900 RepID=A0AAD7WGT8_9TELE|nr:hypothetical protein AAFF_G00021630 [Aldrovandia affinis]